MRRLDHLDALRAGAMLVVVLWHVTVFWPPVLPLSPSSLSVIQWPMALSRWSLPLFFLMAGFFGALLHARWGTARFARDRLVRIGVPLLIGLVTIVPVTWLLFNKSYSADSDIFREGPLHLWFLWYLLLFYALVAALPHLPGVAWLRRRLVALLGSALAVPVLAAFTTALLFAVGQLPPAPALWLVPQPVMVVFYGSFFAIGALVHGSSSGMDLVGRRLGLNAALALASVVPTVLLSPGPIWVGLGTLAPSGRDYLRIAAICLLAWSGTFAVCGLGRRWLAVERPALRYVADSSYWIYLMHLPLALALVLVVTPLGLPFPVAWLLVVTLLFSILLALYELIVRHSVVGRVLNGPRPPRGWGPRRPGRDRVPEGASG